MRFAARSLHRGPAEGQSQSDRTYNRWGTGGPPMPRPRFSILVLLAVLTSGSLGPGLVSQDAPQTSEPAAPATPRTTSLQGTAIFTRNRPVAGATVVVSTRSRDAVPRILVTATDARGTFRIDGLSEGSYDVEFLR